MWTFATLVAGIVQEGQNGDVDPQFIIIIVLCVLCSSVIVGFID